jgi:hypothetical protein
MSPKYGRAQVLKKISPLQIQKEGSCNRFTASCFWKISIKYAKENATINNDPSANVTLLKFSIFCQKHAFQIANSTKIIRVQITIFLIRLFPIFDLNT